MQNEKDKTLKTSNAGETPILELDHLCKYFKIKNVGMLKAVDDVSFSLRHGETLGLVGESGCGKTTLGRTIVTLYKPDHGTITFEGKVISKFHYKEKLEYKKNVQMIFQDPYASLDPLLTVGESVAEGLEIHHIYDSKEKIRERVLELLNMVGLNSEHANRFPHEFSGGQRQRIGIARALAVEPKLIVCDEPISALDVSIQAQIVNLLMKLQKEMGLSYIFITHDLSMVRQISDRIAVMYLGHLVEVAPSIDIYDDHRHPYTEALLSAIPIPDPLIEARRKRILLSDDVPSPLEATQGCCFRKRCAKACEKCLKEMPPLREVRPGHFVACHFADNAKGDDLNA